LGAETFSRRFAPRHHCSPRHDGDRVPVPRFLSSPKGKNKLIARPWPAGPAVIEHRTMFEEEHGIIASQAAAKKTGGILRIRGHCHFPARIMDEFDFVRHRVPRITALKKAARHPENHWRGEPVIR